MTATEKGHRPARAPIRQAKVIVVFRNDDPSAISNLVHEREIFDLLERHHVPQTLAVIPKVALTDHHDPSGTVERPLKDNRQVAQFLKDYVERTGSEVALHGFTHRCNRFSVPARREYAEFKYLPLPEQEVMMRGGLDLLEEVFGCRPVTFVPPWNRWDVHTLTACRRQGCQIISAGPYVTPTPGLISLGANTNLEQFQKDFKLAKKTADRAFLTVLFHSVTLTSAQKKLLAEALDTVCNDEESRAMTIRSAAELYGKELAVRNEAGCNMVAPYQVPGSVRARAWPYISVAGNLPLFGSLQRDLADAKTSYAEGKYESCRALTPQIDLGFKRVLQAGRLGAFAFGMLSREVATWCLQHLAWLPKLATTWLALTGMVWVVGSVALARKVTARETRREVILTGLLLATGWALGQIISSFVF